MAGLRWSRRAVDNLETVLEFIEQDSPAAATKFAQGVMELVERVAREPMGGPMVPELQMPEIRERLYKQKYRVVYRVTKAHVEIVCISHGARLLRNVLGDEFDFGDEQ